MQEKLFTIFTPTYNRANELARLYASLLKQGEGSFEWLIIDDGSTDRTGEIVAGFIKENRIKIRYVKQENVGKQRSWNRAVVLADTPYFIGVDSDDVLVDDSLCKVIPYLHEIREDAEIAGLRLLSIRHSIGRVDSDASIEGKFLWFQELRGTHLGERIDVFKTEILRENSYPEIEGVRHIPEIWLYVHLAAKGLHFLYKNLPLGYFFDEVQHNRLSKSRWQDHPLGVYTYSVKVLNEALPFFFNNPMFFIKTGIRFLQTARAIKTTKAFYEDLNHLQSTLFVTFLIPFAWVVSLREKLNS